MGLSIRYWATAWAAGLLALTAATGVACSPGRSARSQGPDLLLITIDTLRADHLGSYGFEVDASPRIDALAESGVVFERALAAASTTAPSHASIMTSRYTREHTIGFRNGSTRLEDRVTLAEVLRAGGYRTGAFVGNLLLKRRIGLDRGFDHYDDTLFRPTGREPARSLPQR